MSKAALEAEVARLRAENDQLRLALPDFSERIMRGKPTGRLPENFLERFGQLPDRPWEQVLRFLPAHQVAQMRLLSRRFNNLIKKCSKTMPKKQSDGSIAFRSYRAGEVKVELSELYERKITVMKLAGNKVALSELLRFIRVGGIMYFGEGVSAADEVLDQLSKEWLTIRPETVIFAGDLSQTSRDSLKAFFKKVEPSVKNLVFQNAINMEHNLLSDDVIGAAGRLDGLMVMPVLLGTELREKIDISDKTLLAMADADRMPSYICLMGCSGITPGGICAFAMKWMGKERSKTDAKNYSCIHGMELCQLAVYNCSNVTVATIEKECGFLIGKAAVYRGADDSAMDDKGLTNGEKVCFTVHSVSDNRRLQIIIHYKPFLSHIFHDMRAAFDDYFSQLVAQLGHD